MQGSESKQDELGMPFCPCKVYNGDQNWRNAASFVQQYLKGNEEGVWCCHCWMQLKSSKVWAITPVVLEVNKNPFMNDTSVHKFILAVLWTQLQFHNPSVFFCCCAYMYMSYFARFPFVSWTALTVTSFDQLALHMSFALHIEGWFEISSSLLILPALIGFWGYSATNFLFSQKP